MKKRSSPDFTTGFDDADTAMIKGNAADQVCVTVICCAHTCVCLKPTFFQHLTGDNISVSAVTWSSLFTLLARKETVQLLGKWSCDPPHTPGHVTERVRGFSATTFYCLGFHVFFYRGGGNTELSADFPPDDLQLSPELSQRLSCGLFVGQIKWRKWSWAIKPIKKSPVILKQSYTQDKETWDCGSSI